jgi:short-subunit dehydrogenase
MTFKGKRVWVTGASSGIGEALVPALARRGARVALSARRADRLEQVAAGVRADAAGLLVVPLDVTDRRAVLEGARQIEGTWGGIDVAIFNAGAHRRGPPGQFDSGSFVETMALNYFSVIYGIEAVLPGMLARRAGHLVSVASLAGYRGTPTAAAYGASKAALIVAMDSLRFDLEPRGIRVTVVNPGYVKTALTDSNQFRMPFLMPAERAAAVMLRDIEREKNESHFPFLLSWPMKLLRILPYPVYERVIARATRGQQRARGSLGGN